MHEKGYGRLWRSMKKVMEKLSPLNSGPGRLSGFMQELRHNEIIVQVCVYFGSGPKVLKMDWRHSCII